jgi:hypothetical protein
VLGSGRARGVGYPAGVTAKIHTQMEASSHSCLAAAEATSTEDWSHGPVGRLAHAHPPSELGTRTLISDNVDYVTEIRLNPPHQSLQRTSNHKMLGIGPRKRARKPVD